MFESIVILNTTKSVIMLSEEEYKFESIVILNFIKKV